MYTKLRLISQQNISAWWVCGIFVLSAILFLPPSVGAQETGTSAATSSYALSNDGIFGCLGQGARVQNVGTRAAIGGVYVPVNDAAVTLNTGFLVYKECILDGVARKIAENATGELGRTNLNAIATGRNGNPQFSVNQWAELAGQNDIITINFLNESNVGVMCPAFKTNVRGVVGRAYVTARNKTNQTITCSLPPAGQGRVWDRLAALRQEKNNAYGASLILRGELARTQAANEYNQRERWIINDGFYDTQDNSEDPLNNRVLTPGFIIARSLEQVLGSGFRQLESANEIDQVVSNLFGGLTTQLVSDTRGLVGLTQSLNGQPSYVDRMVAQTSAGVRQQAANAALGVIGAAREIEAAYRQAKEGTATNLTNAIIKLRAAEKQCWELVVPKVQERAQGGTQTCTTGAFGQQVCTTTGGNVTLVIATSTQFSQPIIDSQIAPLATTTINEIRASDAAIALLNQLIASVTNSASASNQQQALLRLDTMVANRQLHTTVDATNAVQQRDSVATALTKLVDDTIKAWGDSTDPNVGWCNVNNTATIDRWFNAWRQ